MTKRTIGTTPKLLPRSTKGRSTGRKRAQAAPKRELTEYTRFFVPPASTPDVFRILDLSDGSGVFFSSHT